MSEASRETSPRNRYARMRSILEVPILNEKYWSKVPTSDASAIMIDLEDSAAPQNKTAVRKRVIAALRDPGYFNGKSIIVRVNNLATPWGKDDLQDLARADGDFLISYPKTESAAELRDVRSVLAEAGVPRELHVMIETARAAMELEEIARSEGVAGLHYGYIDFAADVGCRVYTSDEDDLDARVSASVRGRIAVAAAAYGLFSTGGTLIPEYKDMAKVRSFVESWAACGYTACIAVSPAHLATINAMMAPSADEVKQARAVVDGYERALAEGEPAAFVDGRVVTYPDYRVASLLLERV